MIRDAGFNADRTRRYWLLRRWLETKPMFAYIGLNPSTAGKQVDDPTSKKLVGFTDRFGGGGFVLFNANDLVATDPREMEMHKEPCSEDNYIQMVAMLDDLKPEKVIVMWGVRGNWRGGAAAVLTMLKAMHIEPWTFKLTTEGSPYHPLYLPYSTQLVKFNK